MFFASLCSYSRFSSSLLLQQQVPHYSTWHKINANFHRIKNNFQIFQMYNNAQLLKNDPKFIAKLQRGLELVKKEEEIESKISETKFALVNCNGAFSMRFSLDNDTMVSFRGLCTYEVKIKDLDADTPIDVSNVCYYHNIVKSHKQNRMLIEQKIPEAFKTLDSKELLLLNLVEKHKDLKLIKDAFFPKESIEELDRKNTEIKNKICDYVNKHLSDKNYVFSIQQIFVNFESEIENKISTKLSNTQKNANKERLSKIEKFILE